MNEVYSIQKLFSGAVEVDNKVRLQGWVKTRRDSKAGISFIQLHDGSCFSAIQLVAPNTLDNYESEVLKLTAGCSMMCCAANGASKAASFPTIGAFPRWRRSIMWNRTSSTPLRARSKPASISTCPTATAMCC